MIDKRIEELYNLEDGWLYGEGIAPKKELLDKFKDLFNLYYDNSHYPAIFPTGRGNLQLEWSKDNNNIILEVNIISLKSQFFHYDDLSDDENEEDIDLERKEGWLTLNTLLRTYL